MAQPLNHQFGAHGPKRQFAADWNDWNQIRNPRANRLPYQTIIDNGYRTVPYVNPPPPAPLIPAFIPPVLPPAGLPVIPPVATPTMAQRRNFLSTRHRPPELNSAKWKGVKILGSGAAGHVTQWKYHPAANEVPLVPATLAVKVVISTNEEMSQEGATLQTLGAANSQHVVQLLYPPRQYTAADVAREKLGPEWVGVVRRLIMEYCPQGSWQDLIDRREDRNLLFKELTLWRIFECLVDSASVLAFRGELAINPVTLKGDLPAGFNALNQVVIHHDLKPGNIVAGERNNSHPGDIPVFKLTDFGAVESWDRNTANIVTSDIHFHNQGIRMRGTDGYYTPESFTDRWNYNDFQASPVANRFGSHTNVWQIGACMYRIICGNVPEPNFPFLPTVPLNGRMAPGILYGRRIKGFTNYSQLLRDTIHETLYEVPAYRLNLERLKEMISIAINERVDAGEEEDLYEDLCVVEPQPADQLAASAAATARRNQIRANVAATIAQRLQANANADGTASRLGVCTAADPANNFALCNVRVRQTTLNQHPRCAAHVDLVRYPIQP